MRGRPVVFLTEHATPRNLLAVHALTAAAQRPFVLSPDGTLASVLSAYDVHPFVEGQLRQDSFVLCNAMQLRAHASRGELAAVLIQDDSLLDFASHEQNIRALPDEVPKVALYTSDTAGSHRGLDALGCRTLRGNWLRSLRERSDLAPYLAWGLLAEDGAAHGRLRPERDVDVCFVGSLATNPARPHNYAALESEAQRGTGRFALRQTERGGTERLCPAAYRSILERSRIVIDLWGNGAHTHRLYEGLAVGALVISQSPRWAPSAWTPMPGRDFVTFGDTREMISLIRHFIAQPEAAAEIAAAGSRWLREHFTAARVGAWLASALQGEAHA